MELSSTLEQAGGLTRESLPQGCDAGEVLPALLGLRDRLREGFERIVNGEEPEASWKAELEERVERAPLAYKLCGRNLIPVPMGPSADAIASLVALDALNLLATGDPKHSAGVLIPIASCSLWIRAAGARRMGATAAHAQVWSRMVRRSPTPPPPVLSRVTAWASPDQSEGALEAFEDPLDAGVVDGGVDLPRPDVLGLGTTHSSVRSVRPAAARISLSLTGITSSRSVWMKA